MRLRKYALIGTLAGALVAAGCGGQKGYDREMQVRQVRFGDYHGTVRTFDDAAPLDAPKLGSELRLYASDPKCPAEIYSRTMDDKFGSGMIIYNRTLGVKTGSCDWQETGKSTCTTTQISKAKQVLARALQEAKQVSLEDKVREIIPNANAADSGTMLRGKLSGGQEYEVKFEYDERQRPIRIYGVSEGKQFEATVSYDGDNLSGVQVKQPQ